MVYRIQRDIPMKENRIKRVREWLKPKTIGKFGLSFNWGEKEVFIGIAVAKIEMETIIRRNRKKVMIKGASKVVDISNQSF